MTDLGIQFQDGSDWEMLTILGLLRMCGLRMLYTARVLSEVSLLVSPRDTLRIVLGFANTCSVFMGGV